MGSMALACALIASLGPVPCHAESGSGQRSASTRLDFRIVIPAIVRVKALEQPAGIAVSEQDIAQGYIDIDRATSLLLTSNSTQGYSLGVAFDAQLLDRVRVRIAGQQFDAGAGTGRIAVHAAKLVDAPVEVGYRLYLKAGVHPGTYRWPVMLAFAPGAV